MVLNQAAGSNTIQSEVGAFGENIFLAAVDEDTEDALGEAVTSGRYIRGNKVSDSGYYIRVDQGLNTDKLDPVNRLSSELTEKQYMIHMDNRLGSLVDVFTQTQGSPSFIDDDQIATYYITQGVGQYIKDCLTGPLTGENNVGPRQTRNHRK